MSTLQLENYWNSFAELYDRHSDCYSVFTLQLWTMLRAREANNIIESGVGNGYILPLLLMIKKPECRVIATDLSSTMVGMCAQRIQTLQDMMGKEQFGGLDQNQIPLVNSNLPFISPKFNLEIHKADSENLSFIPNESQDIYSSSLVLNITPEPEQMLKEAFRVLKRKGRIGCSVWGSRENSPQILLADKIFENNGIQFEKPKRTPFHLNNPQILIEMFQKAGFDKCRTWSSILPVAIEGEQDMEFFTKNPRYIHIFQMMSSDQKEKVISDILQEIKHQLYVKQNPMYFEGLFIIAEKP